MKEIKTYVTFLLVCGILVGILAFLYSPNNPKTNTISVIENIESRTVGDDTVEKNDNGVDTQVGELQQDTASEEITEVPLTQQEKEAQQKKRIHLTTILLRKQQQLDDLRDKKNRTTGSTQAIETEIKEVEALIVKLTEQIRELSR